MKLLATVLALLFLLMLLLVAFPLGSDYALPVVLTAWQDPARQDVSPAAVEAAFEMQSAMVLGVFLAVPALGVVVAVGGRERR